MARVTRTCWIYRSPYTYGNLPRRPTGITEFDYAKRQALPEDFPEHIEEPPALWAVYLRKKPVGQKWIFRDLHTIFGPELRVGKLKVFKNIPFHNNLLWRVKHLIDVQPITFPNGEPTEEDISHVQLRPDGNCVVDKRLFAPDTVDLEASPPDQLPPFETVRLRLNQKFSRCHNINEDETWADPQRSSI